MLHQSFKAILDKRGLVAMAASASLGLFERLAIVLLAIGLRDFTRARALCLTGVFVAAMVAKGGVRTILRARVRRHLASSVVESLVRGDVLRASPLPGLDPEVAVFEGMHRVERLICDVVPSMLSDASAAVLVGVLLVVTEPVHPILAGGLALLASASSFLAARRLTAAARRREHEASLRTWEHILFALGGRLEIAASGRADLFLTETRARTSQWVAAAARAELWAGAAGRLPLLLAALVVGGALLLEQLAKGGGLSLEAFGEAAVYAAAAPAFAGLARGVLDVAGSKVQVTPLLDLLASRAPSSRHARTEIPDATPSIQVDEIGFTYPSTEPAEPAVAVLRAVSFDWSPGQLLALTGPNGSGKSTCLRLLLGLAEPSTGRILAAGRDLRTLDVASFRQRIAFLPQRPYLPERATVREAMRLLASNASDPEIERALDRVGLLAPLRAHHTSPLDARVGTLSVGQRQRLGLARVLVQNARILLLDEPDANLDAAGVQRVRDLVLDLTRTHGCMVAVAAHTPELVAAADVVVKLGPGGVMEAPAPLDSSRPRVVGGASS